MEHVYIVTYDIAHPKRWRAVFGIMEGYGEWLQLSVFQCRLSRTRLVQMEASLVDAMNQSEDHVLIMDLGPADSVSPKVRSFGKAFQPLARKALIV